MGRRLPCEKLSNWLVFQGALPGRPGVRVSPGLHLDARWERIGEALNALQATWHRLGVSLSLFDADVTVALHGPYQDLSGELHATGRRARTRLQARVIRGARLDADLSFAGFVTTDVLEKELWPMLGGRLTGHVGMRAELAPHLGGLMGVTAEMIDTSLKLDRDRPGPWPVQFLFSLGRAKDLESDREAKSELKVGIRKARLSQGAIRFEGIPG